MRRNVINILWLLLFFSSCIFRNGVYHEYNKNGEIVVTKNYKKGKLHGPFTEFGNNQEDTLSITYYKNGKIDSLIITFYDNQNIESSIEMKNDIQEGLTKYYYKNGNPSQIVGWKNGYLHGIEVFYYENGTVKHFGKNKDGIKAGRWSYFNTKGDTVKVEIYIEGKLKKTIKYLD